MAERGISPAIPYRHVKAWALGEANRPRRTVGALVIQLSRKKTHRLGRLRRSARYIVLLSPLTRGASFNRMSQRKGVAQMIQPNEGQSGERPMWRMPVFEELDVADGTEGGGIDDTADDGTAS